jgi:hypothetical protein
MSSSCWHFKNPLQPLCSFNLRFERNGPISRKYVGVGPQDISNLKKVFSFLPISLVATFADLAHAPLAAIGALFVRSVFFFSCAFFLVPHIGGTL